MYLPAHVSHHHAVHRARHHVGHGRCRCRVLLNAVWSTRRLHSAVSGLAPSRYTQALALDTGMAGYWCGWRPTPLGPVRVEGLRFTLPEPE